MITALLRPDFFHHHRVGFRCIQISAQSIFGIRRGHVHFSCSCNLISGQYSQNSYIGPNGQLLSNSNFGLWDGKISRFRQKTRPILTLLARKRP
jgi:hypothetical protein